MNDENLNIEVRSLVKEFSLDEKIKLGENFGTSVALASTPILAKLLCKRSTLDVIWDYSTKHPDKQRALIFIIWLEMFTLRLQIYMIMFEVYTFFRQPKPSGLGG